MSIAVESKGIDRIDINHRGKNSETYGYAVVHFKGNFAPFSAYHFNFSMDSIEFGKQLTMLQENAERSGFQLNVKEKSRFGLRLEMVLARVLAGVPYANHACAACRMIDAVLAGTQEDS